MRFVDHDAVASCATRHRQPWQLYDLGHGYCSYKRAAEHPIGGVDDDDDDDDRTRSDSASDDGRLRCHYD